MSSCINCYRAIFPKGEIHETLEYQAADRFKAEFIPKTGLKYEWVSDYARLNLQQLKTVDETLDAKAESLIRVIAGGSGLVSIGATLNLSKVSLWVAACWAIALLIAVLCLCTAFLVRLPRNSLLPTSIAWATKYVESYEDLSEARFLGQWHLACEGMQLNIGRKAKTLRVSFVLAVVSIVVLSLSFVVAILTMDTLKTDSVETIEMTDESGSNPSATPNPASQPQTPPAEVSEPAASASPQFFQKRHETASKAPPQSIQASERDSN